jgi:CheY-like chemotaxis protein
MTPKRALIIDDEETIQTIVLFGLRIAAHWEVLTASSGPEGILKAKAERPDVILLDVMMPDMDGITTFKELQAHPSTQPIPVIFLTAKAQTAEKRQFHDVGVNGVITKPFNSLNLADQISKLLNWQVSA